MPTDSILLSGEAAPAVSQRLRERLHQFLAPLLARLDAKIDARLVRTFAATIAALYCSRHRQHGLLLSELGGFLLSPAHAPAGTKRLSHLLHSSKWHSRLVEQYLWEQAQARVRELHHEGRPALMIWDGSVWEKPESLALEGLGRVRSSKGARLTKSKPGLFRRPGPPVIVPGLHWQSLLVAGPSGPPTVAAMRWFATPRAPKATDPPTPSAPRRPEWEQETRAVQQQLLRQAVETFGNCVCHVFDRGHAGSPWLGILLRAQVRFVLRWPRGYHLVDATGKKRPAWEIARGRRCWEQQLFQVRRGQRRNIGVLAFAVTHPDYPEQPLTLVVARGYAQEPWYLLTHLPVENVAQVWEVVRIYARRWTIEESFRYQKSELALESPRVWGWETRKKLLLLVTLAYSFLLSLLRDEWAEVRQWLLRHGCHRTGRQVREAKAPLYRLRAALAWLWLHYPDPNVHLRTQNTG